MIFAQYKHAITFAVVILGLAIVVADPGADDAVEPAAEPQVAAAADLTMSAPAQPVAPATPDAEWYGATGDEAAMPTDNPASAAEDDAGYDAAPAPSPVAPRNQSRPAPAPAVVQAPGYVPPPPPPQVPPSH